MQFSNLSMGLYQYPIWQMLDIWPCAFRPLIFKMGILIPGKVVFVLRQGPDVSMQQKHDVICGMWHQF